MYIEIRVQWTINFGSSHMRFHACDTEACDMCYVCNVNLTESFDRAAHTDTNPKNLELAPPQSVTATRLDQLVYSPNYYIQIFQT